MSEYLLKIAVFEATRSETAEKDGHQGHLKKVSCARNVDRELEIQQLEKDEAAA